jgi:hypothetical protein
VPAAVLALALAGVALRHRTSLASVIDVLAASYPCSEGAAHRPSSCAVSRTGRRVVGDSRLPRPSAASRYGERVAGRMFRRQVSLGVVVWIVVGVAVAARDGFLDDLGSLSALLSAILAVAVWPLVLLDVHFGI